MFECSYSCLICLQMSQITPETEDLHKSDELHLTAQSLPTLLRRGKSRLVQAASKLLKSY